MSERPETPPFNNVDMNNRDADEEEDLFASAVQEVSLDPELNGASDSLAKINLNNTEQPPPTVEISSPIMEEITTERTNNISITVTEPQKVGEGMGSYITYRVLTSTSMPIFAKQEFSVLRRFSDFLGLHDKLSEKYLKTGRIIPPAPEKSVVGTTKLKMASTPSFESSAPPAARAAFVERRRAALERFVNRVAEHPVLALDPDFRQFLESESELPRATSTSALSGAGVLRLFNKVGETVNKITYRMDEADPWFTTALARLDACEAGLRALGAAAAALAGERRELGARGADAARAAAALGAGDAHAALARALARAADVLDQLESLRGLQSDADYYVLAEHAHDHLGLIGAIKDALHSRVKVYQNWQHALMQLNKRRESKAKAELSGRAPEPAAAEIVEWEAKVDRGQQQFALVSGVVRAEVERWERRRRAELRDTLCRYLEEHMKIQAQAIRYWDAFLPEARAIK